MKIKGILNEASDVVKKHSPQILTAVGISGMITATVLAVKTTPKALEIIEDMKEYKAEQQEDYTKRDIVKATYKLYIPSVLLTLSSATCIILSSVISHKKVLAVTAAHTITEQALTVYKDEVVRQFGEKKSKLIDDGVTEQIIKKSGTTEHIQCSEGKELCFDAFSGRYFTSSKTEIDNAVNMLNRQLLCEDAVTLNDLYYYMGLDDITAGSEFGWKVSDGLLEMNYTSKLSSDGKPCLVIHFSIRPKQLY